MQSIKQYCFRLRSCQEMLWELILGFYLGFIISGRSGRGPELPRGVGGVPPGHFLKWICAEKQSGAFWDNFEKGYSAVCTDLVASGWFFQYTIVTYTVYGKDNNTFWGEAGHFFWEGGGESFYPSNTLDRTLARTAYCRQSTSWSWLYSLLVSSSSIMLLCHVGPCFQNKVSFELYSIWGSL